MSDSIIPNQSINPDFRQAVKNLRRRMTPAERARTRDPKLNRADALVYPAATETQYAKELTSAVKKVTGPGTRMMIDAYPRWVKAEMEGTPWRDDLSDVLQTLTDLAQNYFIDNEPDWIEFLTGIGFSVSNYNIKEFSRQSKKATGVSYRDVLPRIDTIRTDVTYGEAWLGEAVRQWATLNYDYLSKYPVEYIDELNDLVTDAVLNGRSSYAVEDEIRDKATKWNRSRPELLARDQVGKLYGEMTRARNQEVGVEYYDWWTARDERVRGRPGGAYPGAKPSHWKMEGVTCDWNDGYKYSTDGGKTWKARGADRPKGFTGQPIQCRCTSTARWGDLLSSVDAEIDAE
jgi:uncharacterized protein with gpF-like domain